MLTKYQMTANLLNKFNASTDEEVAKIYESIVAEGETISEEAHIDVAKEVGSLFEGSEMSAELKEQTIAIFEVAVADATNTKLKTLEEDFTVAIDKMTSEINEENEEKINKYLSYVVEQWTAENKVAIDNTIKLEIAEKFIGGLKGLFTEHNINLTEEESELANKLSNEVAELTEKLNEEVNSKIELKKIITEGELKVAFDESSKGLADTDVVRFNELMEAFDTTDVEVYKSKLAIVKESYFPSKSTVADLTEETVEEQAEVKVTADVHNMNSYTSYLSANK